MLIQAIAIVAAAASSPAGTVQMEIDAAMAASAAGWNAGDSGRFMAIYAPDAIYVAGSEVARGKDAIAARYAKSFVAGGNSRGRLSFRPVAWRTLSPVHQLLVARWTLTGEKTESGLTTLLFERRKEGWRIISDHSS